jgi:hypothetical protein
MTTFDRDILVAVHKHSGVHEAELNRSSICGCFYCLNTFNAEDILEWIDEENPKGATALCPKCGMDSVLGSDSGYPVNDVEFLKKMNARYF